MANGENINVGKAYVTIVPSLQGAQKTISTELGAAAEEASDKVGESSGGTFGKSFSKGLKATAAVVGAAVLAVTGAAVKGVISLTKEAVSNYAEFEQLQGGVQKLFGDSADMVAQFASEAYKTAGLSANDYMETVTGFSASLISSLGGDTAKAAELADQAIRDMSDNANTFGTDIESIQNAYAGFAKGQFNMLDNLKLGYGGTKSEMERLLADAEAISGVKYDVSSYADVVEAIHVIQENMNIAGTTAKEASGTISGSIGSLQGAWTNLLTGIGNDSADLGPLISSVVSSALDVVNNIKPIATQAIAGISELITGLAPIVEQELPPMVESLLPVLSTAILSLVRALSATVPSIMNMISGLITQLLPVFFTMAPVIFSSIFQLITTLAQWLSRSDSVQMIVSGIVQLVSLLANQLTEVLPILLPALVEIVSQLSMSLLSDENLGLLLNSVMEICVAIFNALVAAVPGLISYVVSIFKRFGDLLGQFLFYGANLVASGIAKVVNTVKTWGNNIKTFVLGLINSVKTSLINWITNLKLSFINGFNNIKTRIQTIVQNIKDFVGKVIQNIAALPGQVISIGRDLVRGLWNGISDKVDWVVQKIKSMGSRITNAIKDVFGVASPSKVFAEIGGFLAEGLGVGFESEIGDVQSDMVSSMDGLTGSMTAEVTAYAPQGGLTGSDVVTYNGGNISINVYGAQGQNVNDLANAVAYKLEEMTRRRGVIYG